MFLAVVSKQPFVGFKLEVFNQGVRRTAYPTTLAEALSAHELVPRQHAALTPLEIDMYRSDFRERFDAEAVKLGVIFFREAP